jgi:hypothetical protein
MTEGSSLNRPRSINNHSNPVLQVTTSDQSSRLPTISRTTSGSTINSIRRISESARTAINSLFHGGSAPLYGQAFVTTVEPPAYQSLLYTAPTTSTSNVTTTVTRSNYGTISRHEPRLNGQASSSASSNTNRQYLSVNAIATAGHERLPSYKSINEETTVYLDHRGEVVSIGRTRRTRLSRGWNSDAPNENTQPSQNQSDNAAPIIHDVTASVDPSGRVVIRTAPRCIARQHVYVDDYTCAGILCAILFFPIGIICCQCCCRRSICFYCGYEQEEY